MADRILFFITFSFFCMGLCAQNTETDRSDSTLWGKILHDDKLLSIYLDSRFDAQATLGSDGLDKLEFNTQTFRVLLKGDITPTIRYALRQRFNKLQQAKRGGFGAATDWAYVAFDLGKYWSVMAGKQSVLFGAYEPLYNYADVYMTTTAFNSLDGFKAGVNFSYTWKRQILNLQIVNADSPEFATEAYKNKAFGVSFLWWGYLFDGMLQTRWAYSTFQHEGSKFYNWLTLGTQLNVGHMSAELDYYLGNHNVDYGNIVKNDSLGFRYVREQSVALNLTFNYGKWKPIVKAMWNQRFDKEINRTAYLTTGLQAVTEYHPFTKGFAKDLRFHIMYSFETDRFKGPYSSLDNNIRHTFLGGVRWLLKIK